jgi:hypothetical protein
MVSSKVLGSFLGGVLLMGLSAACSTTPASQAKVAMASPSDIVHRDDAINVMAEAVCKRYESCTGFTTDGKYANADDCRAAEHQKWAKTWSAEDCGGDKHGIVAEKVRECTSRAEGVECSKNLFDKISEWTECRTDKVCKEHNASNKG